LESSLAEGATLTIPMRGAGGGAHRAAERGLLRQSGQFGGLAVTNGFMFALKPQAEQGKTQ
jgi:hypothetical protein